MTLYECKPCKYETNRLNNYTRHLQSEIHQGLVQQDVEHICDCCNKNFATEQTLNRHKTSRKYQERMSIKQLSKQIEELTKDVKKQNIATNKTNNEVSILTTKINKYNHSVNNYNRSVMRVLKEDYPNNPALEEFNKDEIILALEQEYKEKYVEIIKSEDDAKLQKKIIADFENNKIIDSMGRIILNFVKKESNDLQSVFNTDFSRSNYATKTNENWLNDKLGLKFKELVLKPLIFVIKKVITNYDDYLVRCAKKNRFNLDANLCNQIVDVKIKLLDFVEFVNESKNQEQIIYKISPRLQLEY